MVNLTDIVGQDPVLEQLFKGLGGIRRPHAYIFAGPAGVGRRTTALALARTLLCHQPVTVVNGTWFPHLPADMPLPRACGQCPDCRMMADNAAHGDFHLIYKELAAFHNDPAVRSRVMQDLSIDVIRSFLIEPAWRSASRGRGRVFVIKQAELMSNVAQNALLKTLEEPPPGVTIILLAEQPEQLLPTTLSRCRLLRFGLLPRAFVRDKLVEQSLPPAQAEFWADFTDGAIGKAMAFHKLDLYETKRELLDHVAAMNRAGDAELGERLAKLSEKLADTIAKNSRQGQTEMSKTLAVRTAAGMLMELLASFFRDALTLAAGADRPLANRDQRLALNALTARMDRLSLVGAIEQLSELESLLWRNVNPKTIWDNVVITCASAPPLRV
ncbi:MAG: hypothetical protein FWE88_09005 [Phycisphaerae bacterium]|nr:hypothetical protein [Phycisphaerae bacterium]